VQSGLHILIEGSAEERELVGEVAARARQGGRPEKVYGRTDPLGVFAALLARARLLVSNDSAPIHYAEALGIPTVYFAQREKLVHSRPWGEACVALCDETANDVAAIEVERTWGEIERTLRESVASSG
jgi:ADP-heptose:LPS heptosyltransferase